MKTTARAFTYGELLVVIGIISFLTSLLLVALSRSRDNARTIQCASNLREIGIALTNYTASNGNALPTWSGWHVFPSTTYNVENNNQNLLSWTEQLEPYIGVDSLSRVYNCPAFPEEFRINYFLEARWEGVHYPPVSTMKITDVMHSSDFVLSGDCTSTVLYPPGFGTADNTTDDCDKDDASQEAIVFFGEPHGLNMHRGGNNVLFLDGHVDLIHSFAGSTMTYSPHKDHVAWADVTPD